MARVYLPTDPFYTDLAGAVANGTSDGGGEVRFLAIVVEATAASDGAIADANAAAREYLQSPSADASRFLGPERSVILRTITQLYQELQDVLDLLQNFVVGVVAGLYPAWRAARTDPIDALRYE